MELKRILARDSRAANEKAIQLYGPNVLIISSQKLDHQIELIVAVDLDAAKSAPEAVEPVQAAASQESLAEETAFVPFSKLFQSASAFAPLDQEDAAAPVTLPAKSAAQKLTQPTVQPWTGAAPQVATEPAVQQLKHENQRSQEIVDMLRTEMAALRKEFTLSRQMMPWQDGLRLSPAMEQLSWAMSEVGMPAGLRALLTDSIQELDSVDEALPVMHQLLVNALSRPALAIPDAGFHALCGPSGSGKTSMVGRLAWAAAQIHGAERQAMVSFADQRPGAWAQMQLLAAQSGVACYRAADSDMLKALLNDLEGQTVWIDTCGTNFGAQAELLMADHPKVLRHAVLPVDATVTSVQKILQNSSASWASLMLSKMDEAAYPWALIKGLSEQSLAVSCVAGDARINQAAQPLEVSKLVDLALTPLLNHLPKDELPLSAEPVKPARRTRSSKPTVAEKSTPPMTVTDAQIPSINPSPMYEDILIPTLMGAVAVPHAPRKAASRSKVAHG